MPPNERIRINAFGTNSVNATGIPTVIKAINEFLLPIIVSRRELISPMPVPAADVKIAKRESNFKRIASNLNVTESQRVLTSSPASMFPASIL